MAKAQSVPVNPLPKGRKFASVPQPGNRTWAAVGAPSREARADGEESERSRKGRKVPGGSVEGAACPPPGPGTFGAPRALTGAEARAAERGGNCEA